MLKNKDIKLGYLILGLVLIPFIFTIIICIGAVLASCGIPGVPGDECKTPINIGVSIVIAGFILLIIVFFYSLYLIIFKRDSLSPKQFSVIFGVLVAYILGLLGVLSTVIPAIILSLTGYYS